MSSSVDDVVPAPRNLQGRRHPNPLTSAARIVALLFATFGALAGGVWYSSSAACRSPCRIDGTMPRMAALGQRDKTPSLPEHNARQAREEPATIGTAPPTDKAPRVEPPPPIPAKLRDPAPRPSAGMRTDLPPPVRRDERWKEKVMREGNVR